MKAMYILKVTLAIGITAILCVHGAAETRDLDSTGDSERPGLEQASPAAQADTKQLNVKYLSNYPIDNIYRPNRRCPLCDSSVYPYCGEKLLHDACCCTNPYIHDLPYECKLADCRFLHANNCRQHGLIATCCCSDDYRSLLKTFTRV